MPIREAELGDIRAIAELTAAAFIDEELFGELMHPHRHEHPEDFVAFFERRTWTHWFEHKRAILVSLDPESGKVVGAADWERQGEGAQKRELARFDPRNIVGPSVSLSNRWSKWIWPNRAADPSKLTILDETFPHISLHWEGSRKESWSLDLLAVHPDYQGKGHGQALVKWGVDESAREGVCACVIAADGKDGFYGKFGFVKVGMANVGPLAENGIKGGTIMFAHI